jgi:hypothetical protein
MTRPSRFFAALPALAALLMSGLGTAAQAFQLVTEQEAAASRAAPEPLVPRTVPAPDAPRINLVAPSLTAAVPSPTRIQVQFQAAAPAAIKPESFRVRYGALRLDITSRITGAAKVTATGIDVAEAALPKGSHRLFIEIQDSAGRTAERQVQFVVE